MRPPRGGGRSGGFRGGRDGGFRGGRDGGFRGRGGGRFGGGGRGFRDEGPPSEVVGEKPFKHLSKSLYFVENIDFFECVGRKRMVYVYLNCFCFWCMQRSQPLSMLAKEMLSQNLQMRKFHISMLLFIFKT